MIITEIPHSSLALEVKKKEKKINNNKTTWNREKETEHSKPLIIEGIKIKYSEQRKKENDERKKNKCKGFMNLK